MDIRRPDGTTTEARRGFVVDVGKVHRQNGRARHMGLRRDET